MIRPTLLSVLIATLLVPASHAVGTGTALDGWAPTAPTPAEKNAREQAQAQSQAVEAENKELKRKLAAEEKKRKDAEAAANKQAEQNSAELRATGGGTLADWSSVGWDGVVNSIGPLPASLAINSWLSGLAVVAAFLLFLKLDSHTMFGNVWRSLKFANSDRALADSDEARGAIEKIARERALVAQAHNATDYRTDKYWLEDNAWLEARRIHTSDAYVTYRKAFPTGLWKAEAKILQTKCFAYERNQKASVRLNRIESAASYLVQGFMAWLFVVTIFCLFMWLDYIRWLPNGILWTKNLPIPFISNGVYWPLIGLLCAWLSLELSYRICSKFEPEQSLLSFVEKLLRKLPARAVHHPKFVYALRPKQVFVDKWGAETMDESTPRMVTIVRPRAVGFNMGSPAGESGRFLDEIQHRVLLTSNYALSETPITVGQFENYLRDKDPKETPLRRTAAQRQQPRRNVNWYEAQEYANWLNRKLNIDDDNPYAYRLPTEAEFEFAARAGGRGTWVTSNNRHMPHDWAGDLLPADSYPANAFGLKGMLGVSWEWVADHYDSYDKTPKDGSCAHNVRPHSSRVLRGGSWNGDPVILRSANRNSNAPGFRSVSIGFRLARTLLP